MSSLAFKMGASMRRRQLDPGLLEGEELDRWYRRSPDQIEAEREAARVERYNAFFGPLDEERASAPIGADQPGTSAPGQGAGWREARAVPPPAPMVRPGGVRIGVPAAVGDVPGSVPRGGFFDTHEAVPNPALGPAYITDLPSPLNVVTPKAGGHWFELGDGTLVNGVDEVERIHAEQQRRMRGEDDPEPAARVRSADRFKDGVIPKADQIEKGQREQDATCHPNGGWERDPTFATNPERSRRYETQITRAPGLDYVVRNPGEEPVKFDGCAVWDPRHQLLEAKGPGYAALAEDSLRYPGLHKFRTKTESQARHQAGAARGRPVDWHVAEPEAVPYFAGVLGHYPSFRLRQTPAR